MNGFNLFSISVLFGSIFGLFPNFAAAGSTSLVCSGDFVVLNERDETTSKDYRIFDLELDDHGAFYFKWDGQRNGFSGDLVTTHRSYDLAYIPDLTDVASSMSMSVNRTNGTFSLQVYSLFVRTGIVTNLQGNGTCIPYDVNPLF
jgi:hypothetical protein